jgi:Bacterial PH domain
MSAEGENAYEVSVAATRADYRAAAYRSSWVMWAVPLFLAPMLWAFACWVIGQTRAAALIATGAVLLLSGLYLAMSRTVGNLPDWVFAPVTFRIADEGLTAVGPAGHRLLRWGAITAVRKDDLAYWFHGPGGSRIPLFRRPLSSEQEQSIDSALVRVQSRLGEPLQAP